VGKGVLYKRSRKVGGVGVNLIIKVEVCGGLTQCVVPWDNQWSGRAVIRASGVPNQVWSGCWGSCLVAGNRGGGGGGGGGGAPWGEGGG
jgi:hypothetical protein